MGKTLIGRKIHLRHLTAEQNKRLTKIKKSTKVAIPLDCKYRRHRVRSKVIRAAVPETTLHTIPRALISTLQQTVIAMY